jgi:hypothetical protein
LKLKALTTVLMMSQNQKLRFDAKQIATLLKVSKLQKAFAALAARFDCTELVRALTESQASAKELETILKPLLGLKSVYVVVQQLIQSGCSDPALAASVKEKLQVIQKLEPDHFKQSSIFILKQLQAPQLREQVLGLIGGQDCSFGVGESRDFGILSGLGSHIQQNREAALKKLAEKKFTKGLNGKEKELSHLLLLQLISQHG